jgi:hypothetical protein
MEDIVRAIHLAPGRVYDGGHHRPTARIGVPAVEGPPAVLHKYPRTLAALWDEWENGIGGRKAARDFTRAERGRNKYKYSRRLVVWKCMQRLLERGATVSTAIRRITSVYGEVSVTKTINMMRRDERNGGHHRLR